MIMAENPALLDMAALWGERLGLPVVEQSDADIILRVTDQGLSCSLASDPKLKPLQVDFVSGQAAHRRQYGGGRGQLIAKAVGLPKHPGAYILDVTAGLGRDAFVLASLGAQVTMIERSPIVAALLQDGLNRYQDAFPDDTLTLSLQQVDALDYLEQLTPDTYPDVIYCDPMFPERVKSAAVKKEMRILRTLVGEDPDASELFALALRRAKKRVVVKRSKLAPCLVGPQPDVVYSGKSSRFDMYLPKRWSEADEHSECPSC